MANTLRFKRGLASGLPTGVAGEPLFTTDTFDLYIGNGTGNTRFQKYIANGTTSQILRGDGSLYTFPLAISSPSAGQVLKYNGTSWVNDSDAGITGSGSAGQVAYFTGSTTQAGNNNLFWDNTNGRLGIGTNTPARTLDVRTTGLTILNLNGGTSTNQGSSLYIQNGNFCIGDAASFVGGTPNANFGLYTSTAPLIFYIGATSERARFHATGNFGIGTGATDSGQRLQVVGTSYFSDSVGIGSTSLTGYNLRISNNITGVVSPIPVFVDGTIQATATGTTQVFRSSPSVVASATISEIRHFSALQGTFGAGSTVSTQTGFFVHSGMTGATTDYGFYGDLAAGTNVWNLYMNGTANNYMNGGLFIGTTTTSTYKLDIVGNARVTGVSRLGSAVATNGATTIEQIYVGDQVIGSISARQGSGALLLGYGAKAKSGADGYISTFDNFTSRRAVLDINQGYFDFVNTAAVNTAIGSDLTPTVLMRLASSGNLLIGSTTDSGEKLQVTGTMKVTGSTSIGGASTITGSGAVGWDNTLQVNGGASADNSGTRVYIRPTTNTFGAAIYGGRWATTDRGARLVGISNGGVENTYVHLNGESSIMQLATAATVRMTLDASGNLGLGVTPSAWSVLRGLQVGLTASVSGYAASTEGMFLSSNSFYNGGNFIYQVNGNATSYVQISGQHRWNTAASGTAGNAITFTQAMTLDASGNLLLGSTTSSGERLQVTGTAKITGATAINAALTITNATLPSLKVNHTAAGHAAGWFDTNEFGILVSSASTSASHYLTNMTSGGTSRFYVRADGNVGIGSTSPDAKLRVAGTVNGTQAIFSNVDGRGLQISTSVISGTNEAGVVLNARSSVTSGTFIFQTDGTQRMQLDSAGLEFPNNKGLLFDNASASAVGSIKMGTGVTNPLEITNGTHTVTLATLGTFISSNLLVGASTIGTSATNTIAVVNGTAPSSSATDIFHLYSADVTAGNAAPHFRTENGAIIKLYQETTAVGNSIISLGGGNAVLDDTTFDGYTLRQIVKALRNQGILA
jgi:hypothetical protein